MNNEPVVPFGWFRFESEENKSPYTQITGYTYERFSTIKPDGSAKIDEGSLIPVYTHPVKELTYEDGIEECAQRAEAYAYMSPNFTVLAEELREILRKAQDK